MLKNEQGKKKLQWNAKQKPRWQLSFIPRQRASNKHWMQTLSNWILFQRKHHAEMKSAGWKISLQDCWKATDFLLLREVKWRPVRAQHNTVPTNSSTQQETHNTKKKHKLAPDWQVPEYKTLCIGTIALISLMHFTTKNWNFVATSNPFDVLENVCKNDQNWSPNFTCFLPL